MGYILLILLIVGVGAFLVSRAKNDDADDTEHGVGGKGRDGSQDRK